MSGFDPISALGGLSTASTQPINPATEPANIRNGGKKAQEAYATALQFEQVLVNQLTQQMANSTNLGSDDSADGSGSQSLLGSGPASSEIQQMLPGALTSSIMGSGGLGNLADALAAAIDPAINDPAKPAAQNGSAAGNGGTTA
jgi:hypothetical protein